MCGSVKLGFILSLAKEEDGGGQSLPSGWGWASSCLTPVQNLQKFLVIPNPQNGIQVPTGVLGNLFNFNSDYFHILN